MVPLVLSELKMSGHMVPLVLHRLQCPALGA